MNVLIKNLDKDLNQLHVFDKSIVYNKKINVKSVYLGFGFGLVSSFRFRQGSSQT